jgi:hypothetical protein
VGSPSEDGGEPPVRLNLQPASINRIPDSCLEILEARIREKGIAVTKRYAPRLPSLPVDHEKIEQALINVLLNALEALPEEGRIEIVTRPSKETGRAWQVEVIDDGPGINELGKQLKKVEEAALSGCCNGRTGAWGRPARFRAFPDRPFVRNSRPMDWPGTLKLFKFFKKAIEKKFHKL